jgi:hypothetical protein
LDNGLHLLKSGAALPAWRIHANGSSLLTLVVSINCKVEHWPLRFGCLPRRASGQDFVEPIIVTPDKK